MKKLEVSKILMLMSISVGLIACGSVQQALNTQDLNQEELSLKKAEGGGQRQPVKKSEGGGQIAAPSDIEEGGGQMTVPSELDEGGGQKAAPIDTDEGGGQLVPSDLDEGGGQKASPSDTISELEEGGGQLTVNLTDNILTIKGVAERDDSSAVIVINGTDKFEIKVSDLGFYTQIELSKEDMSKMIFDVVVDGKVMTHMIYEGVLKEYNFR
jgi:hypothetical protein